MSVKIWKCLFLFIELFWEYSSFVDRTPEKCSPPINRKWSILHYDINMTNTCIADHPSLRGLGPHTMSANDRMCQSEGH